LNSALPQLEKPWIYWLYSNRDFFSALRASITLEFAFASASARSVIPLIAFVGVLGFDLVFIAGRGFLQIPSGLERAAESIAGVDSEELFLRLVLDFRFTCDRASMIANVADACRHSRGLLTLDSVTLESSRVAH
jgi:hypothetical protein